MIAFGCIVSDDEAFRRYAQPGLERAREPGSSLCLLAAVGSSGRSHNLLLDRLARTEDLEAVVIIDQRAQITDPDFCAKVRAALGAPDVGVAGAMGATGVRTIAWWEGDVRSAPATHRYHEFGGGELPAYGWAGAQRGTGEVEAVSGIVMALSPWVAANVRFDEGLRFGHGYDVDFCRAVREAGRKVVVGDLQVAEYRSLELFDDLDLWTEAHVLWAERHGPREADDEAWRRRAWRAEAEREATRTLAYSKALQLDARVLELERALGQVTHSRSWRLTEPLRQVNQWRRRRRERS